jgi:hypothetical protein
MPRLGELHLLNTLDGLDEREKSLVNTFFREPFARNSYDDALGVIMNLVKFEMCK